MMLRVRRWSPWRALRERENTLFGLRDLPDSTGGGYMHSDQLGDVILIDKRLGQIERKVVLAHELVHLERGGVESDPSQSPLWDAVVAREEHRVDRIVAGRLVPRSDLIDWLAARVEPTTAFDVAEAFDVTPAVAVLALLDVAHSQ